MCTRGHRHELRAAPSRMASRSFRDLWLQTSLRLKISGEQPIIGFVSSLLIPCKVRSSTDSEGLETGPKTCVAVGQGKPR